MQTTLKTLSAIVLFGAALTACSSSPEQANIASSDQVASADSMVPTIDDPVVCKRITPIGTRISQKICKKQSDWDQISSVGSAFTEDAQRRSNVGNAVGQ